MTTFVSPVDIANRSLQHLGIPRIAAFTDQSRQATETLFCYDKLRRAELRRAVWTFATRRAVMRPVTSTTNQITFAAYNVATAYTQGDIVLDSTGFLWLCAISNTGTVPGSETGPNQKWVAYFGPKYCPPHDVTIAYYPGDMVIASSVVYLAVAAGTNHAPPNASFWHVVQGATGSTIFTFAPQGYIPAGSTQRTLFQLPANYIRLAPQDPKIAAGVHQNVTAGMKYNDWEIEAGLISSATQTTPFIFRFVADQTDVTLMDDLFCEAVAARMGMELSETFTQSSDKLDALMGIYERAVMGGRMVSAIEAGTTEDDFEDAQKAAQPQRGARG